MNYFIAVVVWLWMVTRLCPRLQQCSWSNDKNSGDSESSTGSVSRCIAHTRGHTEQLIDIFAIFHVGTKCREREKAIHSNILFKAEKLVRFCVSTHTHTLWTSHIKSCITFNPICTQWLIVWVKLRKVKLDLNFKWKRILN